MPEEYCRKPLAAALLLMASSFLLAQGSPSPQDPLANSDLPLLDFGASLLGLGRDRRQVLAGSPARSSFEEELLAVTRGQVDDGLFLQNLQQVKLVYKNIVFRGHRLISILFGPLPAIILKNQSDSIWKFGRNLWYQYS